MSAPRDILIKTLEDIQDLLISEQESIGQKASGRSANSIQVTGKRAFTAQLEMVGYWSVLFDGTGRSPGGRPPMQAIQDWMRAKGIQGRDPNSGRFMSVERSSFLIARKIGDEGTDIFTGKEGVDLETIINLSLEENVPTLASSITSIFVEELNKTIVK